MGRRAGGSRRSPRRADEVLEGKEVLAGNVGQIRQTGSPRHSTEARAHMSPQCQPERGHQELQLDLVLQQPQAALGQPSATCPAPAASPPGRPSAQTSHTLALPSFGFSPSAVACDMVIAASSPPHRLPPHPSRPMAGQTRGIQVTGLLQDLDPNTKRDFG